MTDFTYVTMSWCNWDDFRCVAYMFLLGFKPSEPHLSAYLRDFVGLSKEQINNEVYPVYSYASAFCITLLVLSKFGTQCGSDKPIFVVGALCRLATRFLLLFATSIPLMQLMQVFYSVGTIAETVFSAHCLRISLHPQRTVALSQAAHLISHMLSSLLGDFLLATTSSDLRTLMWISTASVAGAVGVALTLRSEDFSPVLSIRKQGATLAHVYQTNYCGLLSIWFIVSYATYMIIDGYETSFYMENIHIARDINGTINSLAQVGAAACCLLLSFDRVSTLISPAIVSYRPSGVLLVLGSLGAACVLVFCVHASNVAVLGIFFPLYMMSYSFCNVIVYAECRRAVVFSKQALSQPMVSNECGEPLVEQDNEERKFEIVSLLVVVNLWVGTAFQAILTAFFFQWSNLPVVQVYIAIAIGVIAVMGVLTIMLLLKIVSPARASERE